MDIPEPRFAVTPYGDVDSAALDNLRQSFDTTALLELVDGLAPMAQRFDRTGGVRDELLRLHRMAHTVINGANPSESSADDLWEVAAALIDEFRQMSEKPGIRIELRGTFAADAEHIDHDRADGAFDAVIVVDHRRLSPKARAH